MNKYITIFALICSAFMYGQISVKVHYETLNKPKVNWNGFENMPENYKEAIRKHAEDEAKKPEKFVLYYYDGNSFFQKDPDIKLSLKEQKTEFFRLKDKEGLYDLSDYIVEEFYGYYPMDNVSIEYTDETKTIENFNCKAAIYKIGHEESKVWYTEDIPISAGPYNYYKVPGLILKVENSKFLCYATSVSRNVDKKDIKKMDSTLKVYKGEELKIKDTEGVKKLIGSKRQKAEDLIKNIQKN